MMQVLIQLVLYAWHAKAIPDESGFGLPKMPLLPNFLNGNSQPFAQYLDTILNDKSIGMC